MKTEPAWPAPSGGSIGNVRLYRNDGDDFHPAGVYDHDVVADQEVLEAAPRRLDIHDHARQRPSVRLQPGKEAHMECFIKRELDTGKPN